MDPKLNQMLGDGITRKCKQQWVSGRGEGEDVAADREGEGAENQQQLQRPGGEDNEI